jgi:hypothetical protein
MRLEQCALVFGFVATSLVYVYAAVSVAARSHLWMDEVLAVLISREPSVPALIADWWHGSDFSPPTYHLLLHALFRAVGQGDDRLVWRLPSIAAIYGAGLCIYAMLSSRVGRLVALFAFATVLSSSLFEFAVQARPYALLALGLAAALLIWSGYDASRRPRLRAGALWLILALCLGLHFYGLTVVSTVGVAELIWAVSRRQIRFPLWLALVLTAPVEIGLAPVFLHMARFNAADNLAPSFYGKPSLGVFLYSLAEALVGRVNQTPVFLCSTALILAAAVLGVRTARAKTDDRPQELRSEPQPLTIILLAVLALPFVTFLLSLLVTRSFAARYIAGFGLLPAMALALMLGQAVDRRVIALALVVVADFALIGRTRAHDPLPGIASLVAASRSDTPIVVGEGLLYIELIENLRPELRPRLLYLRTPRDSLNADPTNEHEVVRLSEIHSNYHVESFERFMTQRSEFYVLTRPGETVDAVTPVLKAKGLICAVAARSGDASLLLAHR